MCYTVCQAEFYCKEVHDGRRGDGGVSSLTWSEEVGDGVRVATQTCHVDWQETSRTSPAIGGERERE